MWNPKVACCCSSAVVVAGVPLLMIFRHASNIGEITSRTLLSEETAPSFVFETPDYAHRAKCNFPEVYVPEHRRQVKAPSVGSIAANVRAVYENMSNSILERWGLEYEDKLFGGDSMAWSDAGAVVSDKMLNAVLEQDSFVVAFTGNSVAAGHDCLYEQSYPVLLNATMGKLMAAAGVGYTALNVAMGNTQIAPYSYCVDAHAGLDADIISWSFGLEVATVSCNDATAAVELFIRSSTVLPRRPAVLVMDAQVDQAQMPSKEAVITSRNRKYLGYCNASRPDLMEVYRDFGLHNMFAGALVVKHTQGDERFSHQALYRAGKSYPHPMRWHPAPGGHELVADMLFMHYGKVFLGAIQRLEDVAPGLTSAQLRKKQDRQKLSALREAVGLGQANKNVFTSLDHESYDGGGNASQEGERSPPSSECSYMGGGRAHGVLPPAEWCSDARCQGAGNYRCANTLYPLAGTQGSRLLGMVVPVVKEDGTVEKKEEDENGSTNGLVDAVNVLNSDRETFLMMPDEGRWALTLNEVKHNMIDYFENGEVPEGFHKPIDMKWVLVGDAGSGPIEFEFFSSGLPEDEISLVPLSNQPGGGAEKIGQAGDQTPAAPGAGVGWDSRLVVCKPYFIDRIDFADAAGVRFSVDGVATTVVPSEEDGLLTSSCSQLAAEISPGRHRLRVEPLKQGEPFVAISHVVYPA